jgi:hypothetical protein
VACTAAAGAPVASAEPSSPGPAVAAGVFDAVSLTAAQVSAAQTIVTIGRDMHIDRRGVRIAIAVALQESSLNPAATDGPYGGLFEQKSDPASGLYTQYARFDAAGATRIFYTQLLTRVPDYAPMPAQTGSSANSSRKPLSAATYCSGTGRPER